MLQVKAGRRSTKQVQPQFPKPSIYLPPKRFIGPFTQNFKSHSATNGVTADGNAVESLDTGWDQDLSLPESTF